MQNLKKISNEELKNILELHKKWLNNEKGGKRADLSYVDLAGVDLTNVDLSYADLKGANLSYTKLINAKLKGTNLKDADLSYADLSCAKLINAKLINAKLIDTNLKDIDLKGANLYKTKLFYAKVDNMISMENLGNKHRTAYYFYKEDRVICGCFDDTLEKFEEAVSKKYDKDSNYYVAINTFKNMK